MTDKAKSFIFSLLWHVAIIFGVMHFGGYPAPEPPLLIIDFSRAAAAVEDGQPAGQEEQQISADASPARSEPVVDQQEEPEKPLELPPDIPEKIIPKIRLTKENSKKTPRLTVGKKADVLPPPLAEVQEHRSEPTTAENTPAKEADEMQSADREAASQSRKSAGNETRIEKSKEDNGPNKSYDFEFVRNLIVKNLSFPITARRMGLTGKIVVTFILKGDGQAVDIVVVESSGHDILDNNVVATIRRISPFPRPEGAAQIVLPITFHLR